MRRESDSEHRNASLLSASDGEIRSFKGTGTFAGSVANVANCALGAGTLAFPFAVKSSGLIFSPVLFTVCALMLGKSLNILALAAEASGAPTYQAVLRLVLGGQLGTRCELVLEVTVYIYVIGCGVAFLNVISDSIGDSGALQGVSWLTTTHESNRSHLLMLYAACILLPLCLIRRIQSFRFTSTFAVFSIFFMIAVVIRYSVLSLTGRSSQPDQPRSIHYFNWSVQLFKAIPVVCFAFNCHLSFIPLYHELRPEIRSARTMTRVAVGAYAICFSAYMACGARF